MGWLKHILQGRWLGHPLHPALVHLPTGLWPAALLFDALSFAGLGGHEMVRTSFACILGGLLGALLAVPTGLAEWSEIKPGRPARRIGVYHLCFNVVATVIFLTNLLVRVHANSITTLHLLLSLVGVMTLAISGYLGGRMAYDYGIGVARMSKDKWRRIAEAGHANLPPAKEGG